MREAGNIATANRANWAFQAARKQFKGISGGFERGGRVHRTGIYKLHRGEYVIPARGKRRGRR